MLALAFILVEPWPPTCYDKHGTYSASPLPTFVHRLLSTFAVSLRSLNFNDRYDSAFHWIVQFIPTILSQRRSLNAQHHATSR